MTELISDLPVDDRPRERLLLHGPESLSNAELLAILLGSGTRGKNAIQVARELLGEGFSSLKRRDPAHLSKTAGVGAAKACRIAAAFEIARRLATPGEEEQPRYDAETIGSSLVSTYAHQLQERLGAIFLDSRNRIIRRREIYIGTVSHAAVSTRDVIRFALEDHATGIVLFHNHPSGDPSPSAEDIVFTRKLGEALRLVDLALVDHLVIGRTRFHSMHERGLI